MSINRNHMAKWVSQREGSKKEMSIAQIMECQRWVLAYLSEQKPSQVLDLLENIKG